MSTNQLSIVFLVGSLFSTVVVYVFLKPERQQVRSAIFAGILLSLLNFILECLATKLNWYHTSGAWEFLNVPVSLSIMWFFLGVCFCIIYSNLGNLKNPKVVRIIFILICAISGTLYDIKIAAKIEFVRFEEVITVYHIFTIWITLILLTILFYSFLLKKE